MHSYNISKFRHTRKFIFFMTMIVTFKYITGKEISIWFTDLGINICIFECFLYIQSFDNFIRISFSKSKACIETLPFNIYNASVIYQIAECLFKWVIICILQKTWNTWNFKLLYCFWKKFTKNSIQFTIHWNNFIFLSLIYFLISQTFVSKKRNNNFSKCSVISNLLNV